MSYDPTCYRCHNLIDDYGLCNDCQSKDSEKRHEQYMKLNKEIEELKRWAAFCHCCAIGGELPSTRKEFEAYKIADAADVHKDTLHKRVYKCILD